MATGFLGAMNYDDFIRSKARTFQPRGIEANGLGSHLFDFQTDIVRWSTGLGRAAIFAECGLGKTAMQLEWAKHMPKPCLIVAPLAVSDQTRLEGDRFGAPIDGTDIIITNYERLHQFDLSRFESIVLDESSILKSQTGKYRTDLIEAAKAIPYRLACTATPAPNDLMELGNHAEFLGVMSMAEMLATFFVHDGGETQKWRLKGHAEDQFWDWVCTWAAVVRNPADLGYPAERYQLPGLRVIEHTVGVEDCESGDFLFPMHAHTLLERKAARKDTVVSRVEETARLVTSQPDEVWVVWCGLNAEAEAVTKAIPGAVNLTGSDSAEEKTRKLSDFSSGKIRVLVSKASIAGFGLNWQHCARTAYLGLSDSYEQFYQSIRRFYRFGQTREVEAHVVIAETEGAVAANIRRKEAQSMQLMEEVSKRTAARVREQIGAAPQSSRLDYSPSTPMALPSFLNS